MIWYILNEDKTVTALPNGEYPKLDAFKETIKHVGDTTISNQRISTVFLHFDHSINFGTPKEPSDPVLFESMIFGGKHNEYQRRYCTYDEALEGHNNLIKALEEEIDPDFYFND